jgi:hypothetical protein
MAGTIELSEKAFQQMLKKIEEQGGGATHLQERLAELKDTNLANATANSPAVKQSNKMLAQAISESIVSGLSKTLANVIKENSNDEKLERLITQDKEEMDTLNSSVGNLTGEVVNTNALLTDIYQVLRSQNDAMRNIASEIKQGNSSFGLGIAAAIGALGAKITNLFKSKESAKTTPETESNSDAAKKLKREAEKYGGEDASKIKIDEDPAEIERLKRKAEYEPKRNDAGELVDKNGKPLNEGAKEAVTTRIQEAKDAQTKLNQISNNKEAFGDWVDTLNDVGKDAGHAGASTYGLVKNLTSGASKVIVKVTEASLHTGFAFCVLALIQIRSIPEDDPQRKEKIKKILKAGIIEFGVYEIFAGMGAAIGAGGGPITSALGGVAGIAFVMGTQLYFEYALGYDVDAAAARLVDLVIDPPKNINNPKSKGDVLAKFMKGSKEREKDSLNEARRRAEIFNGYADFRPTDQSREFRGGGIGATDAFGFTNIDGGVGADTNTPGTYNKYTGTIYNDDFRNRGIGATDATGDTNITGGVGAGTSVRKETPFKTDNGGMIPIGQYKSSVNKVMSKEVYDYLKSKGLDDNHAIGMLANIQAESSFNAGAVGDNGTSGGLFQHHGSRFRAMVSAAGQDWQHNWKGQIDYALSEQDSKMFLGMNFKSPEEASAWFTSKWERPKDPSEATKRLGFVEQFKKMFTGNDATVATAPQKSGAAVNQTSSMLENNSGKNNFTDALNNNGGGGSTPPPVVGQISNPKIADAGKVNGPVGAAEHDVRDLLMSQAA